MQFDSKQNAVVTLGSTLEGLSARELTRMPARAAKELRDGEPFVADVAGLYQFTGGRSVLVVDPRAIGRWKLSTNPNAGTAGLDHIRALMAAPGFSAANCARSIELEEPGQRFGFDARLLGSPDVSDPDDAPGIAWRQYGNE